MRCANRIVLGGVLVVLCIGLWLPPTAHAATGQVTVWFGFSTTGNGNPFLQYNFQSVHTGKFTSYKAVESPLPVQLQATLHKGFWSQYSCNKASTVGGGTLLCSMQKSVPCPTAAGTWKARTKMSKLLPLPFIWKLDSARVVANCPPPFQEPPICSGPFQATRLLAVDLETGRVSQVEWPVESPSASTRNEGLRRREIVEGKSYFAEEWMILDRGASGPALSLGSSSEAAAEMTELWSSALTETPAYRGQARYLVIQAARHIRHRPDPLVKLGGTRAAGSELPDGRVVLRARFSPRGDLEDVQALEGDIEVAWRLGRMLEVDFSSAQLHAAHDDHRAVVFGVFDVVDGSPRFVAAVPLLPQCCCSQSLCV